MGRTIIPPRGRNALHFHKNCDTTIYVVKGPINIYWKEGGRLKEKKCPAAISSIFRAGAFTARRIRAETSRRS